MRGSRFDPAFPRQRQVQQQEVVAIASQQVQPAPAFRSHLHRKAFQHQQRLQRVANAGLIVDDEDACLGSPSRGHATVLPPCVLPRLFRQSRYPTFTAFPSPTTLLALFRPIGHRKLQAEHCALAFDTACGEILPECSCMIPYVTARPSPVPLRCPSFGAPLVVKKGS